MPVIPDYDREVTLDPGKEPSVNFDTSRYSAEYAVGKAIQGLGATVSEATDHFTARQEQQDRQASSLAYQSLHSAANNALVEAQRGAAPDGSGLTTSYGAQVDKMYQDTLQSVPAGQREQFAQRWAVDRQNFNHAAAEASYKLGRNFDANAIQQMTQRSLTEAYNNPTEGGVDTIVANGLNDINNSPRLTEAEKFYMAQEYRRQVYTTYLGTKYANDPDGLSRELGLRNVNAQPTTAPGGGAAYVPVAGGAARAPAPGAASDPYGNIPDVDGKGQPGQKAKFGNWNSDPIRNDPVKFAELDPRLQAVIAQARRDNPDLRFVIGSGRRTQADEDTAVKNGWSPAAYGTGSLGAYKQGFAQRESEHLSGRAADLWAIDDKGRITFDRAYQDRVTEAMKAAATKLGLPLTAGADFGKPDRPHFQVAADASQPPGSQAVAPRPNDVPLPPRRPAELGGATDPQAGSSQGVAVGQSVAAGATTPIAFRSTEDAANYAGANARGAGSTDYYGRIRAIESGGRNVTNSGSGATGVYQFLPSTWRTLIAKHSELGLTQADIHDPAKQEIAIRAFTRDNAAVLQAALGRPPTDAELYMAHQQGAGGAARLLSQPDRLAADIVGTRAITSNGGSAGMTAGQFVQMWERKYNGIKGIAPEAGGAYAAAYSGSEAGNAAGSALSGSAMSFAPHTGLPGQADSPSPVVSQAGGSFITPSGGMRVEQTGGTAPAGVKNGALVPYLAQGAPPEAVSGLNSSFAGRLAVALNNAPEEVRQGTVIGSGYRDEGEQGAIQARAVEDHGADGRQWVAPPGRSNHNTGVAGDLHFKTPEAAGWWRANAARFGLKFPLADEPWHVEPHETRGGGHPAYGNGSIYVDHDEPVSAGGSGNPKYASLTFQDAQKLLAHAQANQQRAQKQQEQAAKVDAYNTTQLINDDIASLKATGQGVQGLDENRVAAVLGPQAVDKWRDLRSTALDTFTATAGMESMSSDQLEAHAEKFHPGPQDAGVGFGHWQSVYQAVKDKAHDLIEARSNDPANAVASAPNVVQAQRALAGATSPADQTKANEGLISARLAAQNAVGVPAYAQSPITEAEAKSYASRMRPLSRGQAEVADQDKVIAGIVDEIGQRYGRYSPDVLRRVMFSVTLKQDAADAMSEAIERQRKTVAGPLVTADTAGRVMGGAMADRMAAQSGASAPLPTSAPAPAGSRSSAGPKRSFIDAQDMVVKNPALLPDFIAKYGEARVPKELRGRLPKTRSAAAPAASAPPQSDAMSFGP